MIAYTLFAVFCVFHAPPAGAFLQNEESLQQYMVQTENRKIEILYPSDSIYSSRITFTVHNVTFV